LVVVELVVKTMLQLHQTDQTLEFMELVFRFGQLLVEEVKEKLLDLLHIQPVAVVRVVVPEVCLTQV
jgi:hypothetical protein